MIACIDDHRGVCGVEPICGMLWIAPSTYHAHVTQRADPARASHRARQDLVLMERIRRVHAANFGVYGARKVWRQLGREGTVVARCTVERLMRRMGLRGAVRGKETRTTVAFVIDVFAHRDERPEPTPMLLPRNRRPPR